jgi:carboxymethylenebutenolidase
MKASDFPQELLNLFDGYVHGGISRREFMEGAQKYAVGGMTAAALFEALKPNYALAMEVQPDDKRIKGEEVTVPSPQGNGSIKGYLVRPVNAQKLPVVLVVHENRGLNPYIRDVARRLAVNGFMALAPDGLTSVGGYPGDDDKGATLFGQVNGAKMREDFYAAAMWVKSRPDSTGKLGVIGFCFGGGIVNQLAVRLGRDLNAGVPFYGRQPSAEDAAKITAPLMLQYADATIDTGVGAGIAPYEAALKANNKKYTKHVYEGAQHAFNNDTNAARYNKAAADLAWGRTLAFFREQLGVPPRAA